MAKSTIRLVRSALRSACASVQSLLIVCAPKTIQRGINENPCQYQVDVQADLSLCQSNRFIVGFVVPWLIYMWSLRF